MAYDWATIKREFIRGYDDEKGERVPKPTLKQLSERHGCGYDTIRRKASPKQENWEQERHIFDTKTTQAITEKEIEKISDEVVDFDNKSLNVAKEGIDEGLKRLKDETLSTHDYLKISTALTNFQKIGKLALGEPTEHTETSGNNTITMDRSERLRRIEENGSNLPITPTPKPD